MIGVLSTLGKQGSWVMFVSIDRMLPDIPAQPSVDLCTAIVDGRVYSKRPWLKTLLETIELHSLTSECFKDISVGEGSHDWCLEVKIWLQALGERSLAFCLEEQLAC